MRQEHSRRPVWEFADRVQITRSVLEAPWKALVVPAPLIEFSSVVDAVRNQRIPGSAACGAGSVW